MLTIAGFVPSRSIGDQTQRLDGVCTSKGGSYGIGVVWIPEMVDFVMANPHRRRIGALLGQSVSRPCVFFTVYENSVTINIILEMIMFAAGFTNHVVLKRPA